MITDYKQLPLDKRYGDRGTRVYFLIKIDDEIELKEYYWDREGDSTDKQRLKDGNCFVNKKDGETLKEKIIDLFKNQ